MSGILTPLTQPRISPILQSHEQRINGISEVIEQLERIIIQFLVLIAIKFVGVVGVVPFIWQRIKLAGKRTIQLAE